MDHRADWSCFETSFEATAEREETKYHDLVASTEREGYNTILVTLEMGSHESHTSQASLN